MMLNHIGVINKTEDQANAFYHEVMRLEKQREFIAEAGLSRQLFSLDRDIKVLVFGNDSIKIEVFIYPEFIPQMPNMSHFGIFVPDLQDFLARAKDVGAAVITGEHNGKTVHFVQDFSGNMIEVKQSA